MTRFAAAAVAIAVVASSAAAFDLQGHRGARGLAPENTLEGFARALSIGVSTLEFDLGVTQGRHRRGPARHLAQSRHDARP